VWELATGRCLAFADGLYEGRTCSVGLASSLLVCSRMDEDARMYTMGWQRRRAAVVAWVAVRAGLAVGGGDGVCEA